jgi:hypothetical protein
VTSPPRNAFSPLAASAEISKALPLRLAQLKAHIHSFLMAYNFAKRLKSLKGLTPYENICKIWTTQPNRFGLNPLHHTVGLNKLVRGPSSIFLGLRAFIGRTKSF